MLTFYLSIIDNEEDKRTFAEIYEQLKLICHHVALKITNNHALAEDAVHNAFLAVVKHKNKIFPLSQEKRRSKIIIITKNKAIDLLRMENKRLYTPIDEMVYDALADDLDFTESITDKESYEYLINCIASIPEIYKTTFELRYVHDMNNSEISELLDIRPENVSMRINRAKSMLREIIKKEEVYNNE